MKIKMWTTKQKIKKQVCKMNLDEAFGTIESQNQELDRVNDLNVI